MIRWCTMLKVTIIPHEYRYLDIIVSLSSVDNECIVIGSMCVKS